MSSSYKSRVNISMRYPFLVLFIFLTLTSLYLLSGVSYQLSTSRLLSLAVVGIAITFVSFCVFHKEGAIGFDITRPLSLYGIFYFLYYLFAYVIVFLSGTLPAGNELTIAFLLLLGYSAWYVGVRSSGIKEGKYVITEWTGKQESLALLILCTIGMGLIIYVYTWRTSHDVFFTHAMHYGQELSVASSVRDVFISQFQLPIILLLGFLSCVKHKAIASISHRLFILYGTGIFLILVISSQTRGAITALIFILVSVKTFHLRIIKFRYIIAMGLIGFLAVLFIQGVRLYSHDLIFSDSQFRYSITRSGNDAVSGLATLDSYQVESMIDRAGGGVTFLSTVIDATKSENGFLHGKAIVTSLYSLIPRFIWPEKPAVVSPQFVLEEMLSIPFYDAAVGPITQFYAEGGWIGVVVGFFLFGLLMGKLTSRGIHSKEIGTWMILCFLWSHISNLELEMVLGCLGTLRNAFIVYLFYRLLLLIMHVKNPEKRIPLRDQQAYIELEKLGKK